LMIQRTFTRLEDPEDSVSEIRRRRHVWSWRYRPSGTRTANRFMPEFEAEIAGRAGLTVENLRTVGGVLSKQWQDKKPCQRNPALGDNMFFLVADTI